MARNKANGKKKTQIITGTPIYRLLCNLLNEYVRIIKNNMQKDMKFTLGHKMMPWYNYCNNDLKLNKKPLSQSVPKEELDKIKKNLEKQHEEI